MKKSKENKAETQSKPELTIGRIFWFCMYLVLFMSFIDLLVGKSLKSALFGLFFISGIILAFDKSLITTLQTYLKWDRWKFILLGVILIAIALIIPNDRRPKQTISVKNEVMTSTQDREIVNNQDNKVRPYTIHQGSIIEPFIACKTEKDAKDFDYMLSRGDENGTAALLMSNCLILNKGDKISRLDSGWFDTYIPVRVYLSEGNISDLYMNALYWNEKYE